MRGSSGALQRCTESAFGALAHDLDLDLPGSFDEYGERILDVEDAGPRDRTAEAQRYLENTMVKARQLVSSSSPVEGEDLFPTRNPAVDQLLAGGVGRGEMIEAVGWRSSGRFSLVLSLLAATTQAGESAALVDLGDHLDPEAARRAGVVLERLLWMRPEHIKQALGCTEMVIGAGFSLVVLDLGTPPLPGGRGGEAAWLRLQRATIANRCALFVSAPYRASGTAAHAVLELHRGAGGWLVGRQEWQEQETVGSARAEASKRTWPGAASAPQLLGGLLGAAELAKMRLGRLKQAAQQARTQCPQWPQAAVPSVREPPRSSPGRTANQAPGSQVVPLAHHKKQSMAKQMVQESSESASIHESSGKSVNDVALQLAVRFSLRLPNGSVAQLAAPLLTGFSHRGKHSKVHRSEEAQRAG